MSERYESPLEGLRLGGKAGVCASCLRGAFVLGYVGGLIWLAVWVIS